MKPSLERLENREVPATTTLLGGTLAIIGDQRADVVDVFVNNAGRIIANVNGVSQSFAAAQVQRVFLDGQGGDDVLTNQVATIADFLRGGSGDDTLQAFGTSSVVLGEGGNDSLYAIVGAGAVLDGGPGRDRIIGNATSIIFNGPADRPNVVFGVAAQPVQLIQGVVYFLGTVNNDSAQITEQFGKLFVTYNGQSFVFNKQDVDSFATVLGAGDDLIINNSSVSTVAYGAGGNDTLIGGSADDLLKGGGGNDFIVGNAGDDDLSADPGIDFVFAGPGRDIVRIDQFDVFFVDNRDLLIRRVL